MQYQRVSLSLGMLTCLSVMVSVLVTLVPDYCIRCRLLRSHRFRQGDSIQPPSRPPPDENGQDGQTAQTFEHPSKGSTEWRVYIRAGKSRGM